MDDRESFLRGLESEDNVFFALVQMRKKGDIDKFRRHKRGSDEDRCGVDFTVWAKGCVIPLQVKSSELMAWKYYQEHGDTINCIIGRGPNLMPRLKAAIREYIWRFRNGAI